MKDIKINPKLGKALLIPDSFPLNRKPSMMIDIKDEINCPFENNRRNLYGFNPKGDFHIIKNEGISCNFQKNKKLDKLTSDDESVDINYKLKINLKKLNLSKGKYFIALFVFNGGDYGALTGEFNSISKDKDVFTLSNGYDKTYICLNVSNERKDTIEIIVSTNWFRCTS